MQHADDDTARMLTRMLERRLRDTFDRFCADVPLILRSLPGGAAAAPASAEGAQFVQVLLGWLAGASSRGRGPRYLLMWYAKTIAEKGSHKLPDCGVVAELLRASLTPAELAEVDLALRAGWDALDDGASLKTIAQRQRKVFLSSLTADDTARLGRYLRCG